MTIANRYFMSNSAFRVDPRSKDMVLERVEARPQTAHPNLPQKIVKGESYIVSKLCHNRAYRWQAQKQSDVQNNLAPNAEVVSDQQVILNPNLAINTRKRGISSDSRQMKRMKRGFISNAMIAQQERRDKFSENIAKVNQLAVTSPANEVYTDTESKPDYRFYL